MRYALATVLMIASLAVQAATEVVLTTTKGEIRLELDDAKAPNSVENFVAYVESGHYDGSQFHRVIAGFMIQGGGFDAAFTRLDTRAPIDNEADNGLKNSQYTIAMARTNDPHSATAQFFINVADNAFLDHTAKDARGWGYAVFGRVIAGEDVVDAIAASATGARGPFGRDVPQDPILIESARVVSAQ